MSTTGRALGRHEELTYRQARLRAYQLAQTNGWVVRARSKDGDIIAAPKSLSGGLPHIPWWTSSRDPAVRVVGARATVTMLSDWRDPPPF